MIRANLRRAASHRLCHNQYIYNSPLLLSSSLQSLLPHIRSHSTDHDNTDTESHVKDLRHQQRGPHCYETFHTSRSRLEAKNIPPEELYRSMRNATRHYAQYCRRELKYITSNHDDKMQQLLDSSDRKDWINKWLKAPASFVAGHHFTEPIVNLSKARIGWPVVWDGPSLISEAQIIERQWWISRTFQATRRLLKHTIQAIVLHEKNAEPKHGETVDHMQAKRQRALEHLEQVSRDLSATEAVLHTSLQVMPAASRANSPTARDTALPASTESTTDLGQEKETLRISEAESATEPVSSQHAVPPVPTESTTDIGRPTVASGRMVEQNILQRLLQSDLLTASARTSLEAVSRGPLLNGGKVRSLSDLLDAAQDTTSNMPETTTIKDAMQSKRTRSHSNSIYDRVDENTDVKQQEEPPQTVSEILGSNKVYKDQQISFISADDLTIESHDTPQPPVATLAHGLERALFNPGVYHLRDPRSRVFNFDPYLQDIMPVDDFDFSALKEYTTSSHDTTLLKTAKKMAKKYTGSTSSMTAVLAHFHFLLSVWRPIDTKALSRAFEEPAASFTAIQRGPAAIFLRWKDGVYAIDADKRYDTPNILAQLGKSMERMLTMPKESFERYRKDRSSEITDAERNDPEAYHYSTLNNFLMRSQLDAYDPRLPGTGMFDLKTRAVVSVRSIVSDHQRGMGYEVLGQRGNFESYEKEYHDMIRNAFLKYSLQVRMGRMEGIYVAFHNIQRIFGFQFISLSEMDEALHGTPDTSLGDQEFKLSLELLDKVLDRATKQYPKQNLSIHFECRPSKGAPILHITALPVTDKQIDAVQNKNRNRTKRFEKRVLGLHQDDPSVGLPDQDELGGEDEIETDANEEVEAEPKTLRGETERTRAQQFTTATDDLTAGPLFQSSTTTHSTPSSTSSPPFPTLAQHNSRSNEQNSSAKEDTHRKLKDSKDKKNTKDKDSDSPIPLVMHLTIRNKLSDTYITRPNDKPQYHDPPPRSLPPSTPTASSPWSIEYGLATIKSPKTAATQHSGLLQRRKKLFAFKAREESEFHKGLLGRLMRMVEKGKKFRRGEDERDRKEGVVVYKEGIYGEGFVNPLSEEGIRRRKEKEAAMQKERKEQSEEEEEEDEEEHEDLLRGG